MIPYVDDIYKQIDEQSNIQLFVEIELSLMRSSEHRMDLNNLYDESVIKLNAPQKQVGQLSIVIGKCMFDLVFERKVLGLNGFVYDDENRIPKKKSMKFMI